MEQRRADDRDVTAIFMSGRRRPHRLLLSADCVDQLEPDRTSLGELRAVGDDDRGWSAGARCRSSSTDGDVVGRRAIEVAGRLVAEQQPRLADERAGDRDALPLAAGQRRRPVIDAIGEADLLDERPRPRRVVVAGARATSVGISTFSSTRALRQQAVILEHEADLLVAERRQRRRRRARTGSRPSSVTVPDVGGSSAPRM